MAKSKIELDVVIGSETVGQAENKTKSLKAQLREMKTLLASGTLDNISFNKLAKEAGELQDRIGDVSNTVRNLASDGKTLDGLVGVTEGIVGGFAAVQGITALVGEENEDLNKSLVKIQASIAALNGIQAVNNALQKDGAALLFLTNIQTKALAAGQTFLKVTTMGTVTATYALRAALIATGIGAIVVLVAALAGAFKDVSKETEAAAKAQDDYNKKLSEMTDKDIENIGKIDEFYKQKAKLNGASNAEILKKDVETYKAQQQLLRDQANYVKGDALQRQTAINEINEKGLELGRQIELKELEIRNEIQAEKDKKQEESQKKNEIRLAKNKQQREQDLAEEKRIAAEKLALDNSIQVLKNELGINRLKRTLSESEQEILDLQLSYNEKYLLAVNNAELQAQLDDEVRYKSQEIKDKYAAENLEKEKQEKDKLIELEKKAAQERIQSDLQVANARKQISTDTFSTLNNLGEIFLGQQYKQSATAKALALAQIAVDTAMAISSLTKNSQANPLNAVTYNAAGAVQFIAGMAQITANILKAKQVLQGGSVSAGGSGGGGSSAGFASSQPRSPDAFIPTERNNDGTIKVTVLESEITSTQQRIKRIKDNAVVE